MTILVVEDDPDQLELRCLILQRSGFATVAAGSPTFALQLAKTESLDCAVIDLKLPTESDGLQLIDSLKSLQPALHIVVLSGTNLAPLKNTEKGKSVDRTFIKGSGIAELLTYLSALASR